MIKLLPTLIVSIMDGAKYNTILYVLNTKLKNIFHTVQIFNLKKEVDQYLI